MRLRAIVFWAIFLLGSACAIWAQQPIHVATRPVAPAEGVHH